MDAPRSFAQRKLDSLAALAAREADGWVATATHDGVAYLVPLSIGWTGTSIALVTFRTSPTAMNMPVGTVVRIGIGATRDVTLVEVEVIAVHALSEAPSELVTTFAEQSGWDASAGSDADRYDLFELRPRLIQAWREVNEISERTLMRDGVWLDEQPA